MSHRHGHAQVHHLALRTCDWTQRLKPLPTTRTRPPRHKAVMGTPRCITCNFALLTGRNVSSHCREGARGTRQTSSHAHAQVHQLRHGTCHCTQSPKLMPTTRTRKQRTDMWDIELHQYSTGRCCEPSKTKRHTSETTKVSCCPPANPLLTAADF